MPSGDRPAKKVVCAICGVEFLTTGTNTRYCDNIACRNEAARISAKRCSEKKDADKVKYKDLYDKVIKDGIDWDLPATLDKITEAIKLVDDLSKMINGKYLNMSITELKEALVIYKTKRCNSGTLETGIPEVDDYVRDNIMGFINSLFDYQRYSLKDMVDCCSRLYLDNTPNYTLSEEDANSGKPYKYYELVYLSELGKYRFRQLNAGGFIEDYSGKCYNKECPYNFEPSYKYSWERSRGCSLICNQDGSRRSYITQGHCSLFIRCEYRRLVDDMQRAMKACRYHIARRYLKYTVDFEIVRALRELFFLEKLPNKNVSSRMVKLIRENCETFIKKDFYSKNKKLIDRYNYLHKKHSEL